MKGRCSGSNSKHPLRIPTSSQRGFQEVWSFDSQIPAAISPVTKDRSCMKRVRFKGLDLDGACGPDAASVHVEAVQPPRCDDAKTSECAFFKKLKEVTDHKSHSLSLNSDSNQIQAKKLKSRSCFGERSRFVDDSCKDIRSSLPIESAAPADFHSFLSQLGSASKNSDLNMKNHCTTPDQVHRTHKDMVEYNNALSPEGTQYRHEETFNRKRQKLCQWVASTSFPEIDGLYLKGYKIISALLDRLIAKSDENNNAKNQNVQQLETDAKTKSLASPESDIECKNIQWRSTRSFMENECGPYFSNSLSPCWSNTSRGRILYLDSPIRSANETHRRYRECESDSALRGGTLTSCAESDLLFPFRKYDFSLQNAKDQNVRQLETDAKTKSLASPESDIECKNIQWRSTRSFMENECAPYFSNSLSPCWSNTSRGRILYLDSPTRSANETHCHYRECESDSALKGGTLTSCAESDLLFPFRKYDFSLQNAKDQNVQQLETDAKTKSLASPESDIECKNIQWRSTRSFMENECGPYFSNSLSPCWSNTSRGRILYLDSPTRSANETHHHYRECESDSALRGGTLTSCGESDLLFPFRKYGYLSDLKELDIFCQPNKYTPMLDWDFDNTKDETNLSIACKDIEMNTHFTSLSSWVDDNNYYPSGLFSSLNFHNNGESKTPLPLPCLSGYRSHDHQFGRHVLEGKELIVTDTSHLPVTLSSTANYFSKAEDCHNDTGYEGGSNFFSPIHNYWFIRKVIKGHHCPTTEALLSSGIVSDLVWKCFPITESPEDHFLPTCRALELPGTGSISSHLLTNDDYASCLDDSSSYRGIPSNFSEDNVSIPDHPSFSFQNLMDKEEQAWPLLLVDESSQDGVEEYLNFEDSKLNNCF